MRLQCPLHTRPTCLAPRPCAGLPAAEIRSGPLGVPRMRPAALTWDPSTGGLTGRTFAGTAHDLPRCCKGSPCGGPSVYFKDSLASVDNTSLTDEDAARDVMVMLAWNWAGEEWVRSALVRYLASYETNSPWVIAASLGLDAAPPWWAWRRRRARKQLLGADAGRGPQPN